jgi:aminopeptidase N
VTGRRNLTREQAEQRARLLAVDSYDISLDLTDGSGGPGVDTFRCTTTVRFRCTRPGETTTIDVAAAAIRSATLNGEPLDTSAWSPSTGLVLPGLAADNELVVDADFAYSSTGQGLHRSVDPVDGEVYLYSQFETADAQRAFACFDQPDLKATFTWHATVPAHWRVVSNMPVAEVTPVEGNGRPAKTVHFTPSPRMSTYVTALCAGPYHEVRRTHDGIDLGYLCRASMAPYLDVDDLHTVTTQGFDFYHANFGIRYPLPKYDQVWVPDFNAGAMENFGCVTHSEAHYLFRSQVTDFEYEQRANTILHELAHMWFGDLVTMRWWDDLWLNESFAEWASHWCNANATRFSDAWTTFLSLRKAWGYRQDQLSSTHPVYADMPDLDSVEVNFDGITYAKGASVIKQLVAYVGEEAFLAGLRRYFAAHAWGNATFSDLLSALEETSGRSLHGWAEAWLRTSQVNTLRPVVEVDGEGRYARVAVRQEAPAEHPTLRDHRIAIGLYDLDGGKLVRRQRLEVDVSGELTEVPELTGEPVPDLLLLNDDDLTYAKIRLDDRSARTLVGHIAGLHSSLARGLCWAAAWDQVRDGELPARDFLELVLRGLPAERDINLVTAVLAQAGGALSFYADPSWTADGWARLAATARATVSAMPAGSGLQLAWARAYASAARSPQELAELRRWLDGVDVPDGLRIDTELRWLLLQALVAGGAAGDAEIDAELARDATASGQRQACVARALRPTPQAKQEAWEELTGETAPPNWRHRALLQGFWHPAQVELTAPWVEKFHDVAERVWETREGELAREFLSAGYPSYHVSPRTRELTDAWLAVPGRPEPARRLMAEGRDMIERALRARATDAAAGGRADR